MANKYFIAIIPPSAVANQISAIKEEISKNFNSMAALKSPPHITLHMPFELEKSKEERFLLGIENWSVKTPLFKIEIKNFSCFKPRVIFLDVLSEENLLRLKKDVVDCMKLKHNIFNQADDLRPFHPHITVAFQDLKKEKFFSAWEVFSARKFHAEFICNSFWVLRKHEKNWFPLKEIKLLESL
jgi:2'-5' RNA ligase